jgi:hypothetical protein
MTNVIKDIKFGKKHEKLVHPLLEKTFGKLKFDSQFANFDFFNDDYYVEHKQRDLNLNKSILDSLFFDKVKYDKYIELKNHKPHLRFFIIWSCKDHRYIWEFQDQVKDDGECSFYESIQKDFDRGRGYLQTTKMINVFREELTKYQDFKV